MNTSINPKQEGLTLLEVLIALLVLAIGMAGLGALLLTALSNVHSASHFSLASAVALDFEERLWHEIAVQSVDGGSTLDTNRCLTSGQIEDVAKELAEQWNLGGADDTGWNWTNAERFRSAGLELEIGDIDLFIGAVGGEPTGINFQRMPVTIRWDEARFGLADDTEVFLARVAVVCRPDF